MASHQSFTADRVNVPLKPAIGAGLGGLALTIIGTYLWTPWRALGDGSWHLDHTSSLSQLPGGRVSVLTPRFM